MMVLHGPDLRQAFGAATRCLERYRDTLNALNVFPVPDGDTGTNMLLTMRSALDKCEAACEGVWPGIATVSDVADGMANGAFWGARGNSGVILSQFFKGLADGLKGKEVCSGADLTQAFALATEAAYKAVGKPVEGTMLTVIRSLSEATQERLAQGEVNALALWETAFHASREALYRTPLQLPVLREAGVVDAGGMGVVVLVGGAFCCLSRQDESQVDLGLEDYVSVPTTPPLQRGARGDFSLQTRLHSDYLDSTEEVQWGYCTQFLIAGQGLDPEHIREKFTAMADSSVVVGDEKYIRVHVHAPDPGPAISYGASLGQLSQIKIENMDHQNQEFVAGHRSREEAPTLAVVAVTPGKGLERLFRENGCAAVVNGGQTRNPSISQLLQAAKVTGAREVIILPNNKNIVVAAEQAASLENSHLHVVPSHTIPQGVAALLAFNPEETWEHNLKVMQEAIAHVVTIEVTQAVRSTSLGGIEVTAGQYIGLLEGQFATVGETAEMALQSALTQIGLSQEQVVTLYWGADTRQEQVEAMRRVLEGQAPGIQVDVVYGGQPHYQYLASVE
jgi:DAK2 domain fusion protein YloV